MINRRQFGSRNEQYKRLKLRACNKHKEGNVKPRIGILRLFIEFLQEAHAWNRHHTDGHQQANHYIVENKCCALISIQGKVCPYSCNAVIIEGDVQKRREDTKKCKRVANYVQCSESLFNDQQ